MAPVTLPPSFYNSFWSPDYRSGLETLFKNLEQGCLENEDVVTFIESQVRAHTTLSQTLLNPPLSTTSPESSSSLQHTLLSLRGASSARGEAHRALALELEQRVLTGFRAWAERHEVRVKEARGDLLSKSGVVGVWEKDVQKLNGLRQTYLTKSRAADDSEDDAKFAPATARSPPPDNYTSSPKMLQNKLSHSNLRRAGTVADRISEKLRAASISNGSNPAAPPSPSSRRRQVISIDGKELPPPPSPLQPVMASPDGATSPSSPREERFIPPTDPDGKPMIHGFTAPAVPDKNTSSSASPDVPPAPILLSGLSLPAQGIKDLLQRFDTYLLTNLAPYSDAPHTPSTRSNAALASRQRSTILGTYEKTFSGEEVVEWLKDNVEGFGGDWERCVEAASELHKMGYFSRIGVGRGFDSGDDTYFVLKIQGSESSSSSSAPLAGLASPLSPSTATNALPNLIKSYLPASISYGDEPAHIRLRRDATKADEAYKEGVRNAEDKRLEMEEGIERGLRLWERWERERLAAVKSVLKQYEEALDKLPKRLTELQQGTSLSVEAFNPEADIKALIEGNRTGPFRPHPHIYESIESDVPDVNFGIDLRRWSGEQGWKSLVNAPPRPKGAIPEALSAMLQALSEMYSTISEDERRKAWIYEVPLTETHMLRNAINNPHISIEDMVSIVKKFNVPVAAGTVKLYLLELNPPVLGWEGWEDAKAVYPAVGADQERDMTSAVTSVLGRLPGSQLFVLDAVIKHFRDLVDGTKSAEADEVYITKLALSVGRTILRPQYESDLTIGDRTPSLFLADLINLYSALFPPLVEKKKKETERVMPVRKRTALVDQRISRSSLGGETDPQHLLELQHAKQHPHRGPSPASSATAPVAPPLNFGPPLDELMREPEEAVKVVPPTPEPKSIRGEEKAPAPAFEQEQASPGVSEAPSRSTAPSPTPSSTPRDGEPAGDGPIRSVEGQAIAAAEGDAAIGGGAAALKRGASGETSRLRGPRGARGPRPAPGRVPSHAANASIASLGSNDAPAPESPSNSSPIEGLPRSRPTSRPTSPAVLGDYTTKPKNGAGSAAPGHSTRGSVSAAIAQFEKKG
ncbi:hypothetical protein CI109_104554 [Kwoniella shandongensis]|uniref:Uncharacterized protein n=1 Tax=Kwoniella shandongensis TaxID=1734106 RepID=A0A5M6BVW7_9TREE|nr:uncharacterized protein CI109_005556 [Kwoniella shandongensis]KAA5526122.1 hypothetical protein CI109_005556 [Kwoniella shandongensis]